MSNAVHPKDRVAVFAAYLSPLLGFPLLGSWLLSAVIPEDSTALPHVRRAFDLHLAALVSCVVLMVGSFFFSDSVLYFGVMGGIFLFFMLADVALLFLAIRGTSLMLWEPVVLGRRKFYRQEPFIG